MRSAESDALTRGVQAQAPAVIGVAAGTILEASNRERLRSGGVVVWLRAGAAALESRAMGADHRAWLETGGGSWIRDAIAERDPLYGSVADIVIDTGTAPAQESVEEILARLRSLGSCSAAISSRAPPERDP